MNCLFILLLLCCCGGNNRGGCCVEHNHSCGCKGDAGCAPVRQDRRYDDVYEEKCDRMKSDCDCHEHVHAKVNQWDYPHLSQGNAYGCNDNCGCEDERRECDCSRK